MYHPSPAKTTDALPPNFTFSSDDPFYFGPATCELIHYKTAAYLVGFVEFIILMSGSVAFWGLHTKNLSMDTWVMLAMFGLTVLGISTTLIMFYGLKTEQARLLWPKIAFIQVMIGILLFSACISIVAMSFGISLTHQLFGLLIKVNEMERDFGPIWPFNIGVVSFFVAAIEIWMQVLVRGAYDFILDKEYFTVAPSIEMEKTLPRPE